MNRFDAEELRRDIGTLQSYMDPKAEKHHPDILSFGFEFTVFAQTEAQHTKDFLNLLEDDDSVAYAKLKTDIDTAGEKVKSAISLLASQSCLQNRTCLSIFKEYKDRTTKA